MEKGRGSYDENRDCNLLHSNGGMNRTQNNMDIDEPSSTDLSSISLFSGVGFIEHPVSKYDTLAGIAIKYGVEIPTPGKFPSPHFSKDLDISRNSNCERNATRFMSFNLLDSFQSLRIKSTKLKAPSEAHHANIPTTSETTAYRKGEFNHGGTTTITTHPMLASSHNPHQNRHRKSRSFADGFHFENVEFTDIISAPYGAIDSTKGSEKLVRRRQKSMADFSIAADSVLNKTYISNGESFSMTTKNLDVRLDRGSRINATSNGVTEVSKLTPILTDDVGGGSFMGSSNGMMIGGRRSSSTCNLQDTEKGNSSSSMWSTSWSLKTDLQALSTAMVTKSIFDGLPRSTTRYKASMD
ncbi:uncharacterized protein LOC111488087 isoform X2 [Cucurbita maxima]|uniref:Uncharacterized protein LOC111488087 isoform X2 n=1 Tax=Cucurbita maxima TaxID=3661 RepID=A0A6J1JLY4_CUCMA|nr:uncharacterized protein LOC111488087 isoform X2 [Cucurbita maxima]